MNTKKIKIFLKLYWIRILIITLVSLLFISLACVVTAGIKAYLSMEPFYQKSTLAQIAFGLYAGIFQALIFASIYMGFHYWFMFGGGIAKMGKKKVKTEKVNVKWADVVGMKSIKKEVWEVIRLIKDRVKLQQAGGKIIKGVLMVGPPGCGKTYLAKAIATETGLPFLHAVGSEFQGMFMGIGSSRIRSLFKEARALSELHGGCIIFIDEIDTIARTRVTPGGFGGGIDYNATVNQLLAELDGMSHANENIVIMAATNVNTDELDPALMRAGRFDRKIYVGYPGLEEREQILQYYLDRISYNKEKVAINKLARLTVGNSPADIANIVREASLIATRKSKTKVDTDDLHEAKERLTLGIKTEIILSPKDKEIAAYHEAGHTMVVYLLAPTQDVFKASIIPRKGMGGATWIVETEERFILNKEEVLGKIKILLGGYVAEKIRFGMTSAGVGDDLSKANQLAEKMVTQWGMGTSGAVGVSSHPWAHREVSERDKEDIINNCINEINEVLRKEKIILDEIAQELLKKDELDYDELEEIFKTHGIVKSAYGRKKVKTEKEIGWDDVIGMDEAKEEAKEIVTLIKDRVTLKQVGGQIIRGLLLFGPPGCGKTYLASAIANEAEIPFITKAGSEFVEMYVGVGASRIRHLFQEAREKALAKGACIIFIDEFDAIGTNRGQDRGSGGTSERNTTLNQLLVEMDGLKEKSEQYNILIIGATNMEENQIDHALLRPGRFDRKIYVDLPSFEDRKKTFTYYLNKIKYDSCEIDIDKFSGITTGWSPAEIANLIREAALLAVRNKKEKAGIKEIEEARERIELGLKRRIKVSKKEREKTAYHEAGHNIASFFFEPILKIFKLSIIPRKKTLGVAWASREGEGHLDRTQLLGRIKSSLAGYAAEKIKYGTTDPGVEGDFTSSIKIAHKMVWKWGMGESGYIGNFHELYFNDYQQMPLMSEEMKSKLDIETQEILQKCLKETEKLLNRELILLDALAKELLEKEELNYLELEEFYKKHGKAHPTSSSL
ncbi:MAG: AAA family ATPase [Candidatus Omnitrophica bacterium]|nr:AAA family ATPase [Candidatus Omnitrophota bacterium]MBU1524012.1 AAA family ATPase [Candidatus Omnitrophota bacterium]